MKSNDDISVQGIGTFLQRKDFANRMTVHETLESTNKTAKELAVSGAAHGTAVIADSQSAGKGRLGRSFHSPSKCGIYMSLILDIGEIGKGASQLITPFTAVCVCNAIESISDKKPQIKWVNDVLLGQKKICGILAEGVTDKESGQITWIVIGIGINFCTPPSGFPEKLRHIAGSVFENETPPITRNRLIAEIINKMMTQNGRFDEREILKKYRERLMILNKRIIISGQGISDSYEATAIDINEGGHLLVKRDDGEIETLIAGDISVKPI